MAMIMVEEIIDHLDNEIKRALEDSVKKILPDAEFSRQELFREFKRNVARRCNTWENIPDHLVKD